MAARGRLHAVTQGEAAPQARRRKTPARAKTVTQAAASGTTRELLVAMRDRVASTVENANTQARDLAALTKRLMEITNEIAAIDARKAQEVDGAAVPDEDFDASAI